MAKIIQRIGYLIAERALIRRIVFLSLSVICGFVGWEGYCILADRPEGHVTVEEVALIGIYIGANGLLFREYQKGKEK